MNLIIDIGNTRIKAALFNKQDLISVNFYSTLTELLNDTPLIKQAYKAIVGSVVSDLDEEIKALAKTLPIQLFTASSQIPIKNNYHSVSTLGSDRLAAAIASFYLYPNANVLTIDAGTCIKYNFTNHLNEYLGGGISPGITMRFKALHQFTSKLPLVQPNSYFDDLIGVNTETSILSGVLNGTAKEIDGIIDSYKEKYTNLICVLTGGDSEYLTKRLKNTIFTHQNLVLKGLNHILNINIERN